MGGHDCARMVQAGDPGSARAREVDFIFQPLNQIEGVKWLFRV